MASPRGSRSRGVPCRPGCGACCIAPSITSPIPGMPKGKPAGVRCVQLTADLRCALFGRPERPAVCTHLEPSVEMCGENAEQAMKNLAALEAATAPRTIGERPRIHRDTERDRTHTAPDTP
jgi:Fe-S-cluster containining protein